MAFLTDLVHNASAAGVIGVMFWGVRHLSQEAREWIRFSDERKRTGKK